MVISWWIVLFCPLATLFYNGSSFFFGASSLQHECLYTMRQRVHFSPLVNGSVAVFHYWHPDCLSCPANSIWMAQVTWAIWAALKKYVYASFCASTQTLSVWAGVREHTRTKKSGKTRMICNAAFAHKHTYTLLQYQYIQGQHNVMQYFFLNEPALFGVCGLPVIVLCAERGVLGKI